MYLCIEPTGDGPSCFVVDSRETFDAIVALDAKGAGYNERDYGPYKFDVKTLRIFTMAKVEAVTNQVALGADEDDWEQAYIDLMT